MTKRLSALMAAIAVCALVGQTQAAVLTMTRTLEVPSIEAVAAGVPAESLIYKYFLTSNVDVVSVNNVQITTGGATIFQVPSPAGSNVEPPDVASVALLRALEADSWITTPSATSLVGPDMPGDGTSTWSDLVDSGPQTNFQFAQITVPNITHGTFSGHVALNDDGNVENVRFNLPFIPEPGSMSLLATGVVSLFGAARRRVSACPQ